jgi:hypothetical protein
MSTAYMSFRTSATRNSPTPAKARELYSLLLERGTVIPDNVLIDKDGPDHVTIALKEDVPVIHNHQENVVKTSGGLLMRGLDWKSDDEVHAILLDGVDEVVVQRAVGPKVANALLRIFQEGDMEDALMVQRLYLAMETHHSTHSDHAMSSSLEILQHAYDTIETFYTSKQCDESDQEIIGAMVTAQSTLLSMIDEVNYSFLVDTYNADFYFICV